MKPAHIDKSYVEHREMLTLLCDGKLDAALDVLDTHIARTRTTYASGVEDIAAADRATATSSESIAPRRPSQPKDHKSFGAN